MNDENIIANQIPNQPLAMGAEKSPSPSRGMGPSVRNWALVFAWLACIAIFSSDRFSANHTGVILLWILHHTVGAVDEPLFEKVHFMVRKGAHLFVYCTLGVLAYRAWKETWPARSQSNSGWMFRWAILALLTVAVVGSLDEWHQSFVPSRTAAGRDVLIDTTGGLLGQLGVAAVALRKREDSA